MIPLLNINTPVLCAGVVIVAIVVRKLVSHKLPLPPGPRGLPIVGNIFDLPPPDIPEWLHWVKHKDVYGPISSVTVFGQTVVILHDREIAVELLEKRSAKFSSRPQMFFASHMCDYIRSLTMKQYGPSWREYRKIVARQIGTVHLVQKFLPVIDIQARRFLLGVMKDPTDLKHHLQGEAGSIILDLLYGYNTTSNGRDPLVDLINRVMSDFGAATVAGAWVVDMAPWLRHLPSFLPGMGFKATARDYKKRFEAATDIPFNFTEQQRANGSKKPSYVSGLLDEKPDQNGINMIKDTAVALYGGGADTTVAALSYFFLAMTKFPEVQLKAQEEIDRIIGTGKLPQPQDRPNLPYVDAIVKEALRWMPIVPLGVPHTSDEDDEYGGYRIPKGSIVMPSVGWFSRDPQIYRDPDIFKPERFLGLKPELDPHKLAFGFGRRVCPGQHLADASLFLAIAQSLTVFRIAKPTDPTTGKGIDQAIKPKAGLISFPEDFGCNITPRSEKHKELILKINAEHPHDDGDAPFIQGITI